MMERLGREWGKPFLCMYCFYLFSKWDETVLVIVVLVGFIYLLLNFLTTRDSRNSALEDQFNRFAKAMALNDDEMAEQVLKEMG